MLATKAQIVCAKREENVAAYHEVTLDESQLVSQLLLLSVLNRSVDLVVVVVQARNVCASELGNFAGGSTNTAPDVKHALTLLNTNLVCKVMLVTGNGLVEWLADGEAAEVEGLAPSELVDVRGKVVVAAMRGGMSMHDHR